MSFELALATPGGTAILGVVSEAPGEVQFQIEIADALREGKYANFLSVWSGPHDFTLDFCVTGQAIHEDGRVRVPTDVVSRVKIPLPMAQDILRVLAEQVTKYEEGVGRIHKPGDEKPTYPPEDLR